MALSLDGFDTPGCDPNMQNSGPEAGTGERVRSGGRGRGLLKLQASAAIACLLAGTLPPPALAQQATPPNAPQPQATSPAQALPGEPEPNYTTPVYMRPGSRNYTKPNAPFPNLLAPYMPTTVDQPRFANSQRLDSLVRDGKIYLSLSDAIVLALENNYDIAIQRYNLDIADTDLLRARAGSTLLGVNSGLVTGTLGVGAANTTALSSGGGPGGTSGAAGGAAAGASGLVLSTTGQGPLPEQLDPTLTGTIQLERARIPQSSTFLTGTNTLSANTNEYNFGYNQGFLTGTALNLNYNNTRSTNNSFTNLYSPALQSNFRVQLTQHLLNGFGTGVNGRFIIEAKNDRRIADSAFRQQLLYTINQVETIYWNLVSDYEDVQAKQRALTQSTQLAADNRKQLQIGTMAPLDVLNADNQVASDQQALITSQSALEYAQLIMKQAISRNLNDPVLSAAPVIPTDRVSLIETPEEGMPVEQLVQQAYRNRPEIEQGALALKNDQITLKAVKNGLLPTVDLYAFYTGAAIGGAPSPACADNPFHLDCNVPTVGYGKVFQNLFNNSGPDKGVGVNINIPIRNRTGQALQARAQLEYRQAQMRLQQLYVQVRIQVINAQYALTNDRAAVQAALAAREYNFQSYQAEVKKLKLGASTTANVLQQERNLAAAENNVITAEATYAKDRASLDQVLANTLDRYGIQIADAVSGKVTAEPVIPGLEPAKAGPEATVTPQQQRLHQTENPPAVKQELPQQAPPPQRR